MSAEDPGSVTSILPDGGTVRPIIRWGEPVMHRELRDVEAFDEPLHRLVADMVATMRAADGVGLAANQIGADLKVFVFDCPDEDGARHEGVVCNPRLELPEGRDRRLDDGDEGCLSLPGAFVPCARPDFARVRGVDHHGCPVDHSGDGLLARCLQHETDHLHGVVFGDRLGKRDRKRLFNHAESNAAHFPAGWPAHTGVAGTPE
jgi:peptide deformylase